MEAPRRLTVSHRVQGGDPGEAAACVAKVSGLSVRSVKDAMAKGAVWVSRDGKPLHRLRRVKAAVRVGDRLELNYDAALLALVPPEAALLRDAGRWSAWVKPAGLLSQGSPWGDHASLLRQVELRLDRPTFLVHRLDREVAGVILVAHDPGAAAAFSALFREGRIVKRYRAEVAGDVEAALGREGLVEAPLDGKPARTLWTILSVDPLRRTTLLEVTIETGRQHQIRRHLAGIGHPVLGDPRYGEGNRAEGLRLTAVELAFSDPFGGGAVDLRAGVTDETPG